MRLVLAALATVLGCCSVTFSIAQVVAKSNPALAYRLAPYDGRITAAYAMSLAGDKATPGDRSRADVLARHALRQDPTAVAAAATLGWNAGLRGDDAAARRYFTYVQRLSRRDLRTQLFMIEDAVQRGDIRGALHQYDITLRVFPTLGDTLYPVLLSASADPAIRRALVGTLAARPLWGEDFIGFVAVNATDPESAAVLFLALRRAGVPVSGAAQAGAVNALIGAGRNDAAWSYYAATHPGADRRRSRDPRFVLTPDAPSQFDWLSLNDGSGIATSIQSGLFDFSAPASVGGPLLQQLQVLPPGPYRLTGHSIAIEQPDGARPYWALSCRGGRELGRIDVPNSNVASGGFTGMLSVPADCPVQMLALIARPSDTVSGLSGQFDRVELSPAAGR